MSLIVVSSVAVLGLFVGSAVWTVSCNQARRRSLFGPPACDIGDGDLPMTAWLPFHGFGMATRCCGDGSLSPWRIPFQLSVALYYALAASNLESGYRLAAVVVFSLPLLIVLLVDAWTRLIHLNVIGVGIICGIAFAAAAGFDQLWRSLVAMIAAAVVFAGLYVMAAVIYRNRKVVPFGLGDVYLAAMIGSMVRIGDVARALFYGIFLGGAFIVVMLATKRINRRQAVAYGPYLCLGTLIVLITA